MLGARSVALVGASPKPDSFGARMIVEARRSTATVHLVNPRYEQIDDLPCVASLAELDAPVDLVLMGVPNTALLDQLKVAASAGARSAVVFGSAHGMRSEVATIADRAGMALCGAGCMGFVNNVTGVRALGYLEPDPVPEGGVTLISHSGSAFSTLLRARRGFGFRLAVSSGQELVTETADYVEYALDDPDTRLIALLMESPRAVPRLRGLLLRAAEAGVPVVILPVGGSPGGRAMVAAHSGALAGADAAWQAFCDAVGAARVRDLAEFTDTIEIFSTARRPVHPGGIATVHDSGAERALTADVAHDLGLPYASLRPATVQALESLLDEGLDAVNPLDVWGTGADTRSLFRACLRVIADDRDVAVTALAVDLVPEFDGDTSYVDAAIDVAGDTRAALAVLTSVPAAVDPEAASRLRSNGIPVLEGTRSGLAALGHLARWPVRIDRHAHTTNPDRQSRWREWLANWHPGMAFELLADYGIPVARPLVARSAADVLAAAVTVGYPLVLKTLGADHKSDVGGVVLGIADDVELAAAYEEMAARLGPDVAVQPMSPSGVEVSIGIVRDGSFGPMVVVAAGGTLVEWLGDRVLALPPVSVHGATGLIDRLRVRELLAGWRGAPGADLLALARTVAAFSAMAIELGDAIDAIEANPVIAGPDGVIAVDALVYPRR